jgi:hypothetical protein
VFSECFDLTSVNISSSVTIIGIRAFYRCRSLKNITIPSSVTKIEQGAFSECESLTSVTLSRWTHFGEDVFPDSAQISYLD